MKNLSYTQEYYLCAVNSKGDVPKLKFAAIHSALFSGGIMELLENGFVERSENDTIVVSKPLGDDFLYLKTLYDYVVSLEKPLNLKRLIKFVSTTKQYDEFLPAIGLSLAALGCADELPSQGLLKNKTKYAPKSEQVNLIIEKIRAELLEDGTITDETLCLTVLLDKSFILPDYFSKAESETLKKRLEEVRGSDTYVMAKDIFSITMAGGLEV